ncbi:MAG: BON domain-containing protein [Pseudomonadota bacterium]
MKTIPAMPRAMAITLALGAALAALPLAAAAQQDAAKAENPKFIKLDKNRDGSITRDEVRHVREFGKAFDEADENKDGRLTESEFIKADAIHDRIVAGKYLEDSVITARVKAALLRRPQLKSLDVSVETLRGEVLLSGFVQDESQRKMALQAAQSVSGVTAVKDAMVVR